MIRPFRPRVARATRPRQRPDRLTIAANLCFGAAFLVTLAIVLSAILAP